MKLILKKESYVPQTFVSKELLLKKYMQSFLKWIYFQNSNYTKYLTREEISNYFFNQIKHPLWYEQPNFKKMVEIDKYLNKHSSIEEVQLFDYFYFICPKVNSKYSIAKPNIKKINLTQLNILRKYYNLNDMENLSEEEADYLISSLGIFRYNQASNSQVKV